MQSYCVVSNICLTMKLQILSVEVVEALQAV
jgi:hypothetical protein